MPTLILLTLLCWLVATLLACRRSMPDGLSVASPLLASDQVTFLTDLTYSKDGKLLCEQQIWPEVQGMIGAAESFIILDIFLYNDLHDNTSHFPALSREVTQALLTAKSKRPALKIWLISDPANTGYGSYPNPYFQKLEAAGVRVVLTNLDRLPDSNAFYAGFWQLIGRFLRPGGRSLLPSPLYPGAPRFNLRGWLALLNFKANHRKIVLTEKSGLITSANNSHDASAANSNIAFRFSGPILSELLKSEQAVTALSGSNMDIALPPAKPVGPDPLQLQLLTEGKIKKVLLEDLYQCQGPATLWMAMFYLAERQVIAALLDAAQRGITINLILDANRDAFGHQKNGVPNKPVATWLKKRGAGRIHIRWYDSHAEQFHTKLIMLSSAKQCMIMGGSANLTRRNIADYNLETCLRILAPPTSDLSHQVLSYFQRLWNNEDGDFTVPYKKLADTSLIKYWQYQLQERSGFSLF